MRRCLAMLIWLMIGAASNASAESFTLRTTTRMLSEPLAFVFEGQGTVTALLGAGTDPHTYQPTRKDVRSFIDADAIVFHGLYFEAQLLDLMAQLDRRKPVHSGESLQQTEDLLYAEGVEDPHTWHDPVFWIETISKLADAVALDLETEVLEERTDILVAAAEQVDAWIATQFAAIPEEQRVIVSAHDAFQYFGQRYGITFEPLLGLSTASETKLARVNELVQLVEERQISAVFSETSVESAGITALREGAASKGIELRSLPPLFSDALGQEGEPGGSYFSMLLENTINMVDAMTGERPEPTPELLAFLSTHNLFHSEETQ